MDVISNSDKKGLGAYEAELLHRIQTLDAPGLDLRTARRVIPQWSAATAQRALSRLAAKGFLRRLARGKYYLPDQDPARAACHARAPAYVSFLNRLHDEGYTAQIPRRLDLAYAQRRTRRARWAGLPITWHPIPPTAFLGYAARPDGTLEATAAKAAADLVHRQKEFGGILAHERIVTAALTDAPGQELAEAVGAYGSTPGTFRRLVHLTEAAGRRLPQSLADRAARLDRHNPIPLDLNQPHGEPVGRMNLIVPTEAP